MAIDNESVGVFQFWLCYGKLWDSSLTYIIYSKHEKPTGGQQSSANRKRRKQVQQSFANNYDSNQLLTKSRKHGRQSFANKKQKKTTDNNLLHANSRKQGQQSYTGKVKVEQGRSSLQMHSSRQKALSRTLILCN